MSLKEENSFSHNYVSESSVGSKIGAIFLLIFTAFIGCCIPIIIQHFLKKNKINEKKYNKVQFFMQLANCFAGGAFIGLSLFHLLPEAVEQVASTSMYIHIGKSKFNVGYILIFVGFSIIFLLERVIVDENDICGHQNKCYESKDLSVGRGKVKNRNKKKCDVKGKEEKEEEKHEEYLLNESNVLNFEMVSIDMQETAVLKKKLNKKKNGLSTVCLSPCSNETESLMLSSNKYVEKKDCSEVKEENLVPDLIYKRLCNDIDYKCVSNRNNIPNGFCTECCIHDTITADELTISVSAAPSSKSAHCNNIPPSGALAGDLTPSVPHLGPQPHLESRRNVKEKKEERRNSESFEKLNKLLSRRKLIKKKQIFKEANKRKKEIKLHSKHDNNSSSYGDINAEAQHNVELCCLNCNSDAQSESENLHVPNNKNNIKEIQNKFTSFSICNREKTLSKFFYCFFLLSRIKVNFLILVSSTSFYLFFALFLHSLLEGIVVGTAHVPVDIWLITIVTVGHKWAEGFSLSTNFISKNMEKVHGYFLLSVFILSSPLGIIVGMIVVDRAAESTIAVVLNNLAVGTILYVATEIITGEFSAVSKLTLKQRWLKYLFFLFGAVLVLVLTFLHFYVGHDSCCSFALDEDLTKENVKNKSCLHTNHNH